MASRFRTRLVTWANLITIARLVATVPCVIAVLGGAWPAAAIIFLLAVASDFADGFVARRRDETSVAGGTLDHACDALFVSATLAALARIELIPLMLPPLVMLAFLQYLLDSKALAGQPLRGSRLGRWNGVAYFVIAGFAMLGGWTRLVPLGNLVLLCGWVLIVTTLISMCERAITLLRTVRHS